MQKECIEYLKIEERHKPNLLSYNLQYFAKDGEGGEKTEPATAKRLKDARSEGKVAKSKELDSAFGLIVLFLCLKIFVSYVGENLISIFYFIYEDMADFTLGNEGHLTTQLIAGLIREVIIKWLLVVLPFFAFGFAVNFLVAVIQVGWEFSSKPMQPKLSKINPLNGFKRIFSKETMMELIKSILKLGIIGIIIYTSLKDRIYDIFILYDLSLEQAITMVGTLIIDIGLKISFVYLILGIADYIYQKRKFNEDMKMTKQEVKDEYKNTEGDPQIKSKQRSRMMEVSRRRMMQDVPNADVVITNPTHLAVALKYDKDEKAAPVVVAKGEDYLAQKIKEIARDNHVEVVENKPLARMLYQVDIGAEIPPELYQPVAAILTAIYQSR